MWLGNALPVQISSTALFVCTSSFLVSAEPGGSSPMNFQMQPSSSSSSKESQMLSNRIILLLLVDSLLLLDSLLQFPVALSTGGFATASDFDGLAASPSFDDSRASSPTSLSALPLASAEPMGIGTSQMPRYSWSYWAQPK